MRVFGAFIYKELFVHGATQAVLGKHAFYSDLHDPDRSFIEEFPGRGFALATRIAGVTQVDLVVHLGACETDFIRIHYHYVVTAVNVRGKGRLVLAAQHMGNSGAQATYNFALGVDDIPFVLNRLLLRRFGFVT